MQSIVLLMADRAWREDNGKVGLAGIFSAINSHTFPVGIPPVAAFLRLVDVEEGHHDIVFNVVFDATHAVLASVTVGIDVPQTQDTLDLPAFLPPLVIPAPGTVTLHASVNGEQMERTILQVRGL